MSLNPKYKQIITLIETAQQIVLFHHSNPDFDTLSSMFAFYHWLLENFPGKKTVMVLDQKNLNSKYFHQYLIRAKTQIWPKNIKIFADCIAIIFDVCQYKRVYHGELLKQARATIVFDHHRSSGDYFDVKIIDSSAVATTQILTNFFINCQNKYVFSAQTAHFLYYGLVTDTGRFLFLNNEQHGLVTGAQLIYNGAKPQAIYSELYASSVKQKRFMGYVLSHFTIVAKLAYLIITQEILDQYQISRGEASGHVNLLSLIDHVEIHAFIIEDRDNKCWSASLRARRLPVNEFAKKYGGGGHKLAAGLKLVDFGNIEKMLVKLQHFSTSDEK